MEIGTAKPNVELRNYIRHHLIDFLEPSETINARAFSELAKNCVNEIYNKGKIPVLTCGTGFYLKAFLYGMFPVPVISSEIKEKVAKMGKKERWELLMDRDKGATDKLSYNDDYRVCRALEINLSGALWSDLKEDKSEGYLNNNKLNIIGLCIDWDRKILYERIDKRAKEMIGAGILEETKLVMSMYSENCPALNSLGYNFAVDKLRGLIDYETFYEKFSRSHRNLAKKQITWFKKEPLLKFVSWKESLDKIKSI